MTAGKKTSKFIVFVDIDGTLAHWKHRAKKAGSMPDYKKNKKAFQMWLDVLQPKGEVLKDPPIQQSIRTVRALAKQGAHIIYLTGREEHLRDVTQMWLKRHKCPAGPLYMRPSTERWKSPKTFKIAVMKTLLKRIGDNLEVLVIDDDAGGDCSAGYKKNGWLHFKVLS